VVGFLADLTTYADYYGLLPALRSPIKGFVMSLKKLWGEVRIYPRFWVGLSRLLLCEEVFRDGMKHLVGSATLDYRSSEFNEFPHDVCAVATNLQDGLNWEERE
jgi:hypothetical protein